MSAIPSAEVVMERIRMALAEVGYPDPFLEAEGARPDGFPRISFAFGTAPPAVLWTAFRLVDGFTGSCYSCWLDQDEARAYSCINGNCAHPGGPARPPRELLRSAS